MKNIKHYTAEEKVAILRQHLLDQVPVSTLSERTGSPAHGLLPLAEGVFRQWSCGFSGQRASSGQLEEKQKRIEFLDKKVQSKDEVLAELMAEHVASKKSWTSDPELGAAFRCPQRLTTWKT